MAQLATLQVKVTNFEQVSAQAEATRRSIRRMANAARTANQEMAKLRDMLAEIGIEYVEDQEVTD